MVRLNVKKMKKEQLRRMAFKRITREIEPLKALIPEGKFFTAWGYVLQTESYCVFIGPFPIVLSDEISPITGKQEIKGRQMITATSLTEFEFKIKAYLDEHRESNIQK